MLKNTKDIIFNIFIPIIPMGAIRYSCPNGWFRLIYYLQKIFPTYILPAKDPIRLVPT